MIKVHACTMIIVHACTMIIVHARTMFIVHACTMIIVHACSMIIVHACTVIVVHACTMTIVHAYTMIILPLLEMLHHLKMTCVAFFKRSTYRPLVNFGGMGTLDFGVQTIAWQHLSSGAQFPSTAAKSTVFLIVLRLNMMSCDYACLHDWYAWE